MSDLYKKAQEDQRRREAMASAGAERGQDWMDALNAIPEITTEEFSDAAISDELRNYADQGYGQDWINTMFELQTDQMSMDRNTAANRTVAAEMASGFAKSGFAQRARDNINFGYARQAGKILGGIENQSADVASRARNVIADLENRGEDYTDYVDALNQGFAWERDKRIQGREFGQDVQDYVNYQQNRTAEAAEKYAKYGVFADIASLFAPTGG